MIGTSLILSLFTSFSMIRAEQTMGPVGNSQGNVNVGLMTSLAAQRAASANVDDPQIRAAMNRGVSPHCLNRTAEPDNNQLKNIGLQRCVQYKQQERENLINNVKQEFEKTTNAPCAKKLDTSVTQCDVKNAIDSLLHSEAYRSDFFDNGFFVYQGKRPFAAVIVETLNYDQEVKKREQKQPVAEPNATYTFNQAGLLIGKAGEAPLVEEKKADKTCAECFEKLKNQNLVDGQNECNKGCGGSILTRMSKSVHTTLVDDDEAKKTKK